MKTLLACLFAFFCTLAIAQSDNSINKIQLIIKQINKDSSYRTKILDNEQFLEEIPDGGGQLTGYFKNGQLVKIVEFIGFSSCINITEYYLKDNKLIFIYIKGKEFKYVDSLATFNRNLQSLTMECRFYFQNDKLIKSTLAGSTRCAGIPSESWAERCQASYLRYIKLLTNK